MSCSECATRLRHVEESEALLRDKRFKYAGHPLVMRERLFGDYEHQLRQALESLEHHQKECSKP